MNGEWISVEERLPKLAGDVLVNSAVHGVRIGCRDGRRTFAYTTETTEYIASEYVTHWMPLPERPKEPLFKYMPQNSCILLKKTRCVPFAAWEEQFDARDLVGWLNTLPIKLDEDAISA
jgi:hypothetical protein